MGGLQSQRHQLHSAHMPRGAWLPCHALHRLQVYLKVISMVHTGKDFSCAVTSLHTGICLGLLTMELSICCHMVLYLASTGSVRLHAISHRNED